jgi:hypothetical protein
MRTSGAKLAALKVSDCPAAHNYEKRRSKD